MGSVMLIMTKASLVPCADMINGRDNLDYTQGNYNDFFDVIKSNTLLRIHV